MDFDGDGISDLISGSWPGELYFFKGEGKGKFAEGKKITDVNREEINLGSASTVHACDWRNTGKLDLLVGNIDGHVWLVPNEGTRKKPAYGEAVKLQAGGKEIRVNHGDSHPILADWENTGKPGLIIGCGDGGVLWCRNAGTRAKPELANPVTLVPGIDFGDGQAKDDGKPRQGSRAKVCVFDWNGDGRLDLLVGDFSSSMGEQPKLTAEQEKEKKELQGKINEFQKELQPYFQEMARVREEVVQIKDKKEQQKKMQEAYQKLAKRYEQELKQFRDLYQAMSKYQASYQTHGYVWLYLRKATVRPATE